MTVGFFGHSKITLTNEEHNRLENIIINILENNACVKFFLGGYGFFDYACANILKNLKGKYDNSETIFITPYINESYLKNKFINDLYDDCIYPPLENSPKKYAIIKRNYWIADNCDFLIFYTIYSFGGAYKVYQYAKRKNIKLINISKHE